MAGQRLFFQTVPVALVGATAKTALQVLTATNVRGLLRGWGFSFDGITPTAVPVLCQLMRQTSAGTMSSLAAVRQDNSYTETIQTSGFYNASAEPTASDLLRSVDVHPQGGRYEQFFPYGNEIKLPGATRIGIKFNAPVAVNVIAWFDIEE